MGSSFREFFSSPENAQQKHEKVSQKYERMSDEDYDEYREGRTQDLKVLIDKLSSKVFIERNETIPALERLVTELKDQIPKYDSIISDDASARLVSLLLRKIIDEKRKEIKRSPTQTFFVAGGRHNSSQTNNQIKKFIAEKKEGLGASLLVTEHIQTGHSILPLIKILEDQEIDFDLAAVSIAHPPAEYSEDIQRHLRYGSVGGAGLGFYDEPQIVGVIKGEKKDPHPIRATTADPELMKEAREDINLVANELVKLVD